MKALVVTAPAELRETLDGLAAAALAARCTGLHPGRLDDPTAAAKYTLRSLARRYRQLSKEIEDLETELERLTRLVAPGLVRIFGVGPDTAAALMIAAGDNPDRLHSEAAFASLCGANPIPSSSGKTNRHRLNRCGDRQANAALYRIVLVRLRHDVRTKEHSVCRTLIHVNEVIVTRQNQDTRSIITNSAPGEENANKYTVSTNLTNGTRYTFQVRAVNAVNPSNPSNEASATPAEIGPPTRPRPVNASVGDRRVILQWGTPEDDGGTPITGYELRRRFPNPTDDWETIPVGGEARSHTVTGLNNGVFHGFYLRARNAEGPSPQTNAAGTPYPGAPGAPPNFTVETYSGRQIKLSWNEPTAGSGVTITGAIT